MASKKAFLQAILDQPMDDAVRLIYADWLEDNGEEDRAEFIRLQIDLSRPRRFWDQGGDIAWPILGSPILGSPTLKPKLDREFALLAANFNRWFLAGWLGEAVSKFPPSLMAGRKGNSVGGAPRFAPSTDWPYPTHFGTLPLKTGWKLIPERGFLSIATATLQEWLRWGGAIVRDQPIIYVDLADLPVDRDEITIGRLPPDSRQNPTRFVVHLPSVPAEIASRMRTGGYPSESALRQAASDAALAFAGGG